MKILRKIIEIDEELCDGCGQCVPGCAEGALQIVDGKARIVKDTYCDGLGACIGDCPNGALRIIEREAEDFDEAAVEEYLSQKEKEALKAEEAAMPCGCPSANIQQFVPSESCQDANKPLSIQGGEASALSHWPVQIRLIPPDAPFLRGADLLIVADCVPVAFPAFHQEMLKGRVAMVGCPKFDDVQEYTDRFAAIFRHAGIRSITTAIMEVPCCSGLPVIVKKAMAAAQKDIPVKEIVISTRGNAVSS